MDSILQGIVGFGPYALIFYTHYLIVIHTLKYEHKLRRDV